MEERDGGGWGFLYVRFVEFSLSSGPSRDYNFSAIRRNLIEPLDESLLEYVYFGIVYTLFRRQNENG